MWKLTSQNSPQKRTQYSTNMSPPAMPAIPETQTAAIVRSIGGAVEFRDDYPVPTPKKNEVLAKILYTGVCQSGMSFRV